MSHLARKALVVGVVAAVALGLVTAFATAASNKPTMSFTTPPSPAEGATLTTNSVSFAFTYNRKAKQVATLTCTLSGPTPKSGCASATTASYSGLDDGNYTFTVSLTLTDGGTASATRHFTIDAVPDLLATVSPNPDVIASATIGVPIARSYTITNVLDAFTGRAVGTTLGSARRAVPSIADLAQQQFPVTVTPGSTSLRATIGGASDPTADLDLFVFNCTTGTCVLAGTSAGDTAEESVTINNPAAGLWIVLVDATSVPAGTTTYNYLDVFFNPAFGSVSVTDANALRPQGSLWTVPGSVTANAAPAAGRVLYGNVQVRTDTNILIGQGDVIINSVTP
jgi:hypothetical protein